MNSTASADRLIWVDLEVKNTIRNFDVIHNLLLLCEFVADASIDYIYGTASPGLKMTGECIVIYINIILYATTNHYIFLIL